MGNRVLPPIDTPARSVDEYWPAIMVSTTVELKCNISATKIGVASFINCRHGCQDWKVCMTIDMGKGVYELNAL